MANQIQIRRGSSTQWSTANPILANAELGYDTDLKKIKVGDGSTAWASLPDLQAMGEWRDVAFNAARATTSVNSTNPFVVAAGISPNTTTASATTLAAPANNAIVYLDTTDYSVTGRTVQMRIVSWAQTETAPTSASTLTVGLYPAGSVSTAGVLTFGSLVTGSSAVTGSLSAATTRTALVGPGFTAPAAGGYLVIFSHSAATGTQNWSYGWKLQVRVV